MFGDGKHCSTMYWATPNSKHRFTTFLQGGRCRKAILGVRATLSLLHEGHLVTTPMNSVGYRDTTVHRLTEILVTELLHCTEIQQCTEILQCTEIQQCTELLQCTEQSDWTQTTRRLRQPQGQSARQVSKTCSDWHGWG